jgi:alpha-glucosidase
MSAAFAFAALCLSAATPSETIDRAVERAPELVRTAPALATRHALKRLICLDLDATLCQHRSPMPPENRAMLDKLCAKYKCIMVGAGNAPRIYRQMENYPIDIVANYGMQESRMVNGKFTIVKQLSNQVDRAFFKEKTDYLRKKYGYTEFDGNSVEFHPSGMVTFGLLGSTAAAEQKVHFDPDRAKRRKMYPEVCEIFKDYSVYIGGSSSFDFAGKKHNKYDAVMDYAARHGYSRDEILFVGDDFDDGGGDSHVRIFGMDYIHIHDFRTFPERTAFLLDLPVASSLVSPDGRVSCSFSIESGRPVADVSFCGRRVFRSSLGIDRGRVRMAKCETCTVRNSWKPVWGFKSEYPENYSELAVKLVREGREGKEPPAETLYLRCYDEGFAVRAKFVMAPYGVSSIAGELTNWRFAEGAAAWGIRGTEATFPAEPVPLEKMTGAEWRMPLTLRIPGVAFASVFEAHAERYPRSYLRAGHGVLSPYFIMGAKEGRGETLTPWRAVALAATPAELVERAYFVENLNPPCTIVDTSWIKPGFCVSDMGNFELRTSEIVAAAKSAAATGAKYIQIDWGWYGTECPWTDDDRADYLARHPELKDDKTWVANTRADPFVPAVGTVPYHPYWPYSGRTGVEMDMPAIVAALKQHGLGLCLYVHGAILEENDMDALFGTYAKWGIVGLKPGFVGYGSQATTDFIRRMCAIAAKHHLWLDIHDLHLPDGIERTWPNLMITEGGGGEEGNHPVRQDVALPFTRCLAGPFDYTPMLFNAGKAGATKLHKLAMFVVYPGATAVMRGSIKNLVDNNPAAVEFLRALPWNYDDTRVFDAEIARHLTVVRRRGDSFYVGGLAGDEAHETSLVLDFLKEGREYELVLLLDDLADSSALRGYRRETRTVRKGDVLKAPMSASGGFCALIKAK